METSTLICSAIAALTSLIAAIAACIGANKKRLLDNLQINNKKLQESVDRKTKEIIALYTDILTFRQMITDICHDAGKNFLTERRKYNISDRSQPKYIEKRLNELKLMK